MATSRTPTFQKPKKPKKPKNPKNFSHQNSFYTKKESLLSPKSYPQVIHRQEKPVENSKTTFFQKKSCLCNEELEKFFSAPKCYYIRITCDFPKTRKNNFVFALVNALKKCPYIYRGFFFEWGVYLS